ncbi:dihydrolipoamide acetyltransferase family protein [Nocardia nova]|uniref:dihydrolipoamide acetyltransferase family protein n=1 Tax=Nocardia nova TaxID=37330 RepID=UPI0033C72CB0
MVLEFRLPDIGEGLTEAEIVCWYVQPGDSVHDGMPVCEVETVKVTVDLPIPFDGVVREIPFSAGATVKVGEVLIMADPPAVVASSSVTEAAEDSGSVVTTVPAEATASAKSNGRGTTPNRPVADLAPVVGQTTQRAPGPARRRSEPAWPQYKVAHDRVHQVVPANGTVSRTGSSSEKRIPVQGVRKATAEAMVRSAFTAPHVTEWVSVDVTRTTQLIEKLRQESAFDQVRITPLVLCAKAFLTAIRQFPEINAHWDGTAQEIVIRDAVHLGVAVACDQGLLVPNVKYADTLPMLELARHLDDIIVRTRAGQVTPQDLSGGTMTVTNIGVFGVDGGTPILKPGESAILAIGAINERPWVYEGQVVPRRVTTLALSFDHRLVDGELGSKVLAATADVLERPEQLIYRA